MMRVGLIVCALSLSAGLMGCGGDDKEMTVADFCTQLAQRECAAVAGKCPIVTTAACEPVRKSACMEFATRSQTGTRVFRPQNTTACLDQVRSVFARNPLSVSDLQLLNDACDRVFGGTQTQLQTCAADHDCALGLICDKGRCAKKVLVAQGAQCNNAGEVCPAGQYCANMSGLSVCTARQTSGATCSATQPCLESLRCDGTCVGGAAQASACTPPATNSLWPGLGDVCATGYCSPYTRVCASSLGFAEDSSSCRAYAGSATGLDAAAAPDAGTAAADASDNGG